MLKTPEWSVLMGNVIMLEEGVAQIEHFSLDIMVWGCNRPHPGMSGEPYPLLGELSSYGVVDTPSQFLARYRKLLQDDQRTFVISFTHIAKDPEHAGRGGGWRWCKWGPYIGEGEPRREYLDDELGFGDGIYVYRILQTS